GGRARGVHRRCGDPGGPVDTPRPGVPACAPGRARAGRRDPIGASVHTGAGQGAGQAGTAPSGDAGADRRRRRGAVRRARLRRRQRRGDRQAGRGGREDRLQPLPGQGRAGVRRRPADARGSAGRGPTASGRRVGVRGRRQFRGGGGQPAGLTGRGRGRRRHGPGDPGQPHAPGARAGDPRRADRCPGGADRGGDLRAVRAGRALAGRARGARALRVPAGAGPRPGAGRRHRPRAGGRTPPPGPARPVPAPVRPGRVRQAAL
ncbi:MAG: Transcriptional regulator, AcrR family, partial [uncultured Blastococcus sp.]